MASDAWPSGRIKLFCGLAILVAAVIGCAAPKLSRTLMPTPLALTLGIPLPGGNFRCQNGDDPLPVFVISGRDIEDPTDPINPFGDARNPVPALGIAYVQVGAGLTSEELYEETVTAKKRKKAKVTYKQIELDQAPLPVDPFRLRDDTIRFRDNAWVQAVEAQMDRTGSHNVTIYVHGYNTDFIDNTLIAGEIYHYMGRKGAMMSFEWPSESKLLGYIPDKANADASTHQFRALISNIAKECDAESITIIAHSAGSPVVVNTLRELRLLDYDLTAEQVQRKYKVGRVVLAAPDMDLQAFENAIYDRFYELTKGVAVYASPKDRALKLSERLNGNARLGRAVGELDDRQKEVFLRVPQIEMVDSSIAEQQFRNFIGHSYYQRDPWVSSDIGSFLIGRTPEARGLIKTADKPVFWQFGDDYPERLEQLLGGSGNSGTTSPVTTPSRRSGSQTRRAIGGSRTR